MLVDAVLLNEGTRPEQVKERFAERGDEVGRSGGGGDRGEVGAVVCPPLGDEVDGGGPERVVFRRPGDLGLDIGLVDG